MKSRLGALLLCVSSALCASSGLGCAGLGMGPDEAPVPSSVRALALLPLRVPDTLGLDPAAEARVQSEIDAAIESELRRRGYDVVPAETFQQIETRLRDAAGIPAGVDTSELPEGALGARIEAVGDHSFRELLFRHPTDWLLRGELIVVQIRTQSNYASWDGAYLEIPSQNSALRDLLLPFAGTVRGVTLRLAAINRSRQPVLLNLAGLELIEIREGGDLKPIPPDELLRDPERLSDALERALTRFTRSDGG